MNEKNLLSRAGFYSNEELAQLGLKSYGRDVLISTQCLITAPELLSVGDKVRIDAFCILSGNITIGSHVHIAAGCKLFGGTAGIIMEDCSGLSADCKVYAKSDDYSGDSLAGPMFPDKYKPYFYNDPVLIRTCSMVGANCLILPKAVIERGCIVLPFSVVDMHLDEEWIYKSREPGANVKRFMKTSSEYKKLLLEYFANEGKEYVDGLTYLDLDWLKNS